MSILPPRWRRLLRHVKPKPDAEVDAEIAFHLEMRAADYIARGLSPSSARRRALERFGDVGVVRDDVITIDRRREKSMDRSELLHTWAQDVRYAVRSLRRSPGFAAVAAFTLALGIGANTAIFSVLNGVILKPLPYADPDRLVILWESTRDLPEITVSYPDYLDWRARTHSFADIAIYNGYDVFNLTGRGEPERVRGGLASSNLFSVLGVKPQFGRTFTPLDDRPGAPRVAVITDALWKRRFAGDRGVIGQTVQLDDDSYTIVGVMPASFRYTPADIWIPIGLFADTPRFVRANHPGLIGLGRLKPRVTVAQMRAELKSVARDLEQQYPSVNTGIGATGAPLEERVVGSIRPALAVLTGAVGLVLLIACVNVANLLLGRAASRQREFAIRAALGAGRRRIIRQLLTESVVLALLGAAGGLAIAWAGVRVLVALDPSTVPRIGDIRIDGTVLVFALGIAIATGMLFGLAPALQALRRNSPAILKEEGRAVTAGRSRMRFRAALVVAEVALALVLLVGAGLLLRSFARLMHVDPGVDPRNVMTAFVQLPERKYPEAEQRTRFFEDFLTRVRALPGVSSAALATDLPITSSWQTTLVWEGRPPRQAGGESFVNGVTVSPGYFSAMHMRLLAGRVFTDADARGAPPVMMVSETVVKRFFRGENPIGRRARFGPGTDDASWMTIIGVVNDVKDGGLAESSRGAFYLPMSQSSERSLWLVARSEAAPQALVPLIRRALSAMDPALPLSSTQTMEQVIDSSVAQPKFAMLLLTVFAAIALVLTGAGVYGVISYAVAQRTHEIGVRIALGARRAGVVGMVVRQVLAMAAGGIVLGGAGALAGGRLLASMLYDVRPTDPLTLAVVVSIVVSVAIAAAALPALRAARTDPITALRG